MILYFVLIFGSGEAQGRRRGKEGTRTGNAPGIPTANPTTTSIVTGPPTTTTTASSTIFVDISTTISVAQTTTTTTSIDGVIVNSNPTNLQSQVTAEQAQSDQIKQPTNWIPMVAVMAGLFAVIAGVGTTMFYAIKRREMFGTFSIQ